MTAEIKPSDLTAIVLAGGKGTRIAQLRPDVPKPLITVAGRPFLFWVTEWLTRSGVRDIVYATGHMAAQIKSWVADEARTRRDVSLRTKAEFHPLGTGGAVRGALDLCGSWVLVINGDSLVMADIAAAERRAATEQLDGVIVGVPMNDASRYGSLDTDEHGMLCGFFEKRPGAGIVNAGIYLFRREVLERLPAGKMLSMEIDMIPGFLAQGVRIGVMTTDKPFLDIGTPESLARADEFTRAVFGA